MLNRNPVVRPRRVAIHAMLTPGGSRGGVEQFVVGLINALGKLDDDLQYCIITAPEHRDWLAPYLHARQQIVCATPDQVAWSEQPLAPAALPRRIVRRIQRAFGTAPAARLISSGFFESLGVDLVHLPYQDFVYCNLPIIYNPHDLQHLHYPQFFSSTAIRAREATWRRACRSAQAVATDSQWVRHDIHRQYRVALRKIYAIPMAAATSLYAPMTEAILVKVARQYTLPADFVFYPAQTWQHKNHLRLLDAMALLRDQFQLRLHLICTGMQTEFAPIAERIRVLDLETQVRFLGFVAPTELRALYRLAQFVVHPSLFEGGGLPALEAFAEGAPLACSNVTSLPEYVGDAALLFDPHRVESIANALQRMTQEGELRATLRQRGYARAQQFSWDRVARAYRALYRALTQVPLDPDEHRLLRQAQTGGA